MQKEENFFFGLFKRGILLLDFEGFLFEKEDLFSRNLLFREREFLKENFCQILKRILFTSRNFSKELCQNIEFFFINHNQFIIF